MMQQLAMLMLLAQAAATPAPTPCKDTVTHTADATVEHHADADVLADIDPATAALVAAPPAPRVERRVGDNDVKVDVDLPEDLGKPKPDCR